VIALPTFLRPIGALAAILAALIAAGPALAEMLDTPECRHDLVAANALISGIAAREKQFVPGNLPKNCGLLRQNLTDLIKAREPMDRCMTGHDHAENIGQIDDSIGDIRTVLADKCRK
jgi:hypothetical protein